jgi:hypothetical protein
MEAETRTKVAHVTRQGGDKITSIWLSTETANDANVRLLQKFPDLVRVKIWCASSWITPDSVRGLEHLRHLEELTLHGAVQEMNEDFGSALSRIGGLRSLAIEYSPVTEAGLKPLRQLPHLVKLKISETKHFRDADVAPLLLFEHLEELDLTNTAVTDACLTTLAKISSLRRVVLTNTEVTKTGILHSDLNGRVEVKGGAVMDE